jgi:hypothetical protein
MITVRKIAICILAMAAIVAYSAAQSGQATVLSNMTEGQGYLPGNSSQWDGWSEIDLIPGGALFDVSTKTIVLTLGFSGGSTANIENMVLYTTARATNVVTNITKVTLDKKANPIIDLASSTTCPVQPVSTTNPCFVKLDPTKVTLSTLDDYYFVVYFTSDSSNETMRGAGSGASSVAQGALSGWQIDGDDSRIPLQGFIPEGYNGSAPVFLSYVTNE